MKKLYTVTVTTEMVVLADDAHEAESVARSSYRDEDPDFDAHEMVSMPGGWEGDSLVYGDHDGDVTVDQAIVDGAAPKYVALMEKLRAQFGQGR